MDIVALGGGMANTFLLAQGHAIRKSLVEPSLIPECLSIIKKAHKKGCRLMLPMDGVVASSPTSPQHETVLLADPLQADHMILDIGPATIQNICTNIDQVKTLIWKGPVGLAEIPPLIWNPYPSPAHCKTYR